MRADSSANRMSDRPAAGGTDIYVAVLALAMFLSTHWIGNRFPV